MRAAGAATLLMLLLALVLLAPTRPVRAADTTPEGSAAAVWKQRCALCHGKTGSPTPVGKKMGAKDVTSDAVQAKSDEALIEVITKGSGKMPSFADQLDDAALAAIVQHVRQLARAAATDPSE